MNTANVVLVAVLVGGVAAAYGQDNHASVVIYWGQNGARNEQDLSAVCKKPYEFIILSFLNIFFDHSNKNWLPGLNFADHCNSSYSPDYPALLHCTKIAHDIKQCQSKGKKVLLSMGGAVGSYGFDQRYQANGFANIIWDLVLGGNNISVPRPFNDAILDGVDLDIEGGRTIGYDSFVASLRSRMKKDEKGRRYYISGAPQCPYPDAYLGPGGNTALENSGQNFDFVLIQFYNNYCGYRPDNPANFKDTWNKWSDWTHRLDKGPKLYVGLLAQTMGNGYVETPDLSTLFELVVNDTSFGGGMIWDASWSEKNVELDKTYGERVYDAIKAVQQQ